MNKFNYTDLKSILAIILLWFVIACETGQPMFISEDYYSDQILNPIDTSQELPTALVSTKISLASPISLNDFDVHTNNSPVLASFGPGLAYSRLLRFRSGPGISLPTMATECDLCERWTQLNPTTYEFYLRDNAYWHDAEPVFGRKVVADDIIQSFMRQLSSNNANAEILKDIKTMESSDEAVIRITINSPNADFLSNLAQGASKIIPIEINKTGIFDINQVVGSGPWVWASQQGVQGYYFDSNKRYFEEGIPYSDKLEIQIIADYQTRLTAFLLGKIDILEFSRDRIPVSKLQEYNIPTTQQIDFSSGVVLSLNTLAEPLDHIGIRRKIIQSVDPWLAITEIWDDLGFVGLGVPLFDEKWLIPRQDMEVYLKAVDSGSFKTNGSIDNTENITITVADYGSRYMDYGNRVADSIRNLGVRVTVDSLNINEYASEVWNRGSYQIFVGPSMPFQSTNSYLSSVFHSRGKYNIHNYRDEYLDLMIDRQSRELDLVARKKILIDLQKHIMENAFWLMPVGNIAYWAHQDHVMNFYPNTFGSEYFYFSKIWIDAI